MDEVSSHVRLDLPTARSSQRLFHLIFGPHDGTAYVPIPERSTSPRVMLRPAVMDSLKVLDPNRPIREADIPTRSANVRSLAGVKRTLSKPTRVSFSRS